LAQLLKVHRNRGRQFGSFGAPSHLAFETEALGFLDQGMDNMYFFFPGKIGKLDETIKCVQRDAIHSVLDSKNGVKPDICPIPHLGFIGFNGV